MLTGRHRGWAFLLADSQKKKDTLLPMNRSQIESAIKRNTPFTLRMADGNEYHVPHRDYISLPPRGSCVIVYDDEEHFYVLPLLTMTGLAAMMSEDGG